MRGVNCCLVTVSFQFHQIFIRLGDLFLRQRKSVGTLQPPTCAELPVRTRAYYRDDRIYAMHYDSHDGRFITGAVFAKYDKRGRGHVFLRLQGPV